jgi:hypothetical protein
MSKEGTQETKGGIVKCAACPRMLDPRRHQVWWVKINGKEFMVCTTCRDSLKNAENLKERVRKEAEACAE